jgi:hypothetical protein
MLWLLALAVAWLALQFIQSNRDLHARLNLLLHGYVFCSLEEPGASQHITVPTNEMIWKLVCKRGACLGYFDLSGQFVALNKNPTNWDDRTRVSVTTDIALFYLRWFLVAGMVVALLIAGNRRRATIAR